MNKYLSMVLIVSFTVLLVIISLRNSNKDISPDQNLKFVAELTRKRSEVLYKRSKTFSWNEAKIETQFANYDAVKTGEGANGIVQFRDSTLLDIDEKSFVIILERAESKETIKNVVALPRGGIKGTIPSNIKKNVELEIRTKRGWIKAHKKIGNPSTSFQAKVNDYGALEVKNIDSNLKVIFKNEETNIEPGKSIVIEGFKEKIINDSAKIEEFEAPPAKANKEKKKIKTIEKKKNNAKKVMLKPEFVIDAPTNGASINSERVKLSGRIQGSLEVFYKGKLVKPSKDGIFEMEANLIMGLNIITFQVVDKISNKITYRNIEVVRK